MTLSDFIIEYRNAHSLSQRQFALQCNVSNGYISMLERNYNPSTGKPLVPTLVALRKISKGMGITLDQLFSSIDDIPVSLDTPAHELSTEEMHLITLYRLADEIDRATIRNILSRYEEETDLSGLSSGL